MAIKCTSCGAPIVWVKTKAGKSMPCDARLVSYKANPRGKKYVVTDQGEVVRCDFSFDGPPDGMARISHFATCPNASRHRKR